MYVYFHFHFSVNAGEVHTYINRTRNSSACDSFRSMSSNSLKSIHKRSTRLISFQRAGNRLQVGIFLELFSYPNSSTGFRSIFKYYFFTLQRTWPSSPPSTDLFLLILQQYVFNLFPVMSASRASSSSTALTLRYSGPGFDSRRRC